MSFHVLEVIIVKAFPKNLWSQNQPPKKNGWTTRHPPRNTNPGWIMFFSRYVKGWDTNKNAPVTCIFLKKNIHNIYSFCTSILLYVKKLRLSSWSSKKKNLSPWTKPQLPTTMEPRNTLHSHTQKRGVQLLILLAQDPEGQSKLVRAEKNHPGRWKTWWSLKRLVLA